MYGMIPRANTEARSSAPPENILNIPNNPFWLDAIISFKAEGSIPACESGSALYSVKIRPREGGAQAQEEKEEEEEEAQDAQEAESGAEGAIPACEFGSALYSARIRPREGGASAQLAPDGGGCFFIFFIFFNFFNFFNYFST